MISQQTLIFMFCVFISHCVFPTNMIEEKTQQGNLLGVAMSSAEPIVPDDSISQINGQMNTRLLGKVYVVIQSRKKLQRSLVAFSPNLC